MSLRSFAVIFILSVAIPQTVLAAGGLFGSLFSSNNAKCAPKDRDCLIELYKSALFDNYAISDSQDHLVTQFAKDADLFDEPEFRELAEKIEGLQQDHNVWDVINAEQAKAAAQNKLSIQGIHDAISKKGWPKFYKWNDFIYQAVSRVLYETDDAEALFDLWMENQTFFEQYAQGESAQIFAYGLNNRLEDVIAYLETPQADDKVAMRSLSTIAAVAGTKCSNNETEAAKQLIQLHEKYEKTQKYSEGYEFLPLSDTFRLALFCEDEERSDAVFAELKTAAKDSTAPQPGFAEGRFQEAALLYAHMLTKEGQSDKAFAVFSDAFASSIQLGSYIKDGQHGIATAADVFSGNLPKEYSEQYSIDKAESFVREEMNSRLSDLNEKDAYAPEISRRFDFLFHQFDPDFKICCTQSGWLRDMVDVLETYEHVPDRKAAMARIEELLKRFEKKEPSFKTSIALERVQLAQMDKAFGCEASEKQLQQWQSDFYIEESQLGTPAHWDTGGLGELIRYLDTPTTDVSAKSCLYQ